MKDIEFVSELLIGVIHGPQGGSAALINDYYTQYEDYDDEFPNQSQVLSRFEKTKLLIKDILSDASFSRFRSNRTDFYSIFVALAVTSISKNIVKTSIPKLRAVLLKFETIVNNRITDDSLSAPSNVVTYVKAAEKGVNDKKRRADRHDVLLSLLAPFFK